MTKNNVLLAILGTLVSQKQHPYAADTRNWASVVDLALDHGLGPMLLSRLQQGEMHVHEHSVLTRLIESAHQTAMESVLLEKAMREVTVALDDARIPALWLKGIALAHTVYPQPTLRPMGDLDVLVPFEQRERALEVVQALGFDFYTLNSLTLRSSGEPLRQKLSHHYHLKGGIADAVILELHYRLLSYKDELLSLDQAKWFWEHQQTVHLVDDGFAFSTLTPEAHLLYLCAHAILQHGEAHLYLLRFFDLHQIITPTDLNWDVIVDQAVVLGWTRGVERALRHSTAYFDTPVPDAVLDDLVRRCPPHEDVSRTARLSGTGHRWERVRKNLGELTLREKVAYVRLIIFPTRAYMRQRYTIGPGRPTGPYYLYRWWDQLRDMAGSIWKHLTGQYR